MLIDTHAHLTDNRYTCAEDIINSLAADNLSAVITVGYNAESSYAGYALAQKHGRVFFAAGIHPSDTREVKDDKVYDDFLKLSKHPKCVGIGEIGLDYHYGDTDKAIQKREFLRQLELVKAADLPVIIHLRDAYEDMYNIIKSNIDKLPKGGVMHCFSGSPEMAKIYVDMGFYISFAGPVTFKNTRRSGDVITAVPRERTLIETDCPYLTPEPLRGRLNYPAYVKYTAQKIAELWGTDLETVAAQTTQNALRLFGKLII